MEDERSLIRKKYILERELDAWRCEVQRLEEDVPQKNWALREAKAALAEYEGGIRGFFDKFSGKRQERVEELSRQVRQAGADLEYAKTQLAQARASLADQEQSAASVPTREELFARYPDSEYLRRQDALLCIERCIRLLRLNDRYLVEARDWAENRNAVYMAHPYGTQYDKSVALKQASEYAKEVCGLMDRIRENGFELEVHSYLRNPAGFIAGAARQYGEQDRINYAIRAVANTLSLMQELQLQLADE